MTATAGRCRRGAGLRSDPYRRRAPPRKRAKCLPAVTGDDGAVGPKAFTERAEFRGMGRRIEGPRPRVALANTDVVDGPHVEPGQLEQQEISAVPSTDASNRRDRAAGV
jgi:DNA polymerase II small subunit/DNA polymerase delta subunit B